MPVQGRLYFHAQGEPVTSLKAFAVLGGPSRPGMVSKQVGVAL